MMMHGLANFKNIYITFPFSGLLIQTVRLLKAGNPCAGLLQTHRIPGN
jgi:Na+/phosphate symporter